MFSVFAVCYLCLASGDDPVFRVCLMAVRCLIQCSRAQPRDRKC